MRITVLKYELKVSKTNQTYGVYTILSDGQQSTINPSQFFLSTLTVGKTYDIEVYTSPATQRKYINSAKEVAIDAPLPVTNDATAPVTANVPAKKQWVNYPKKQQSQEQNVDWDKRNLDIRLQAIIKSVCELNGHRPDITIETVGEQVAYLFRLSSEILKGKDIVEAPKTSEEIL